MNRKIMRGEIYYADLDPIVGSEQGGMRPVLILQNNMGSSVVSFSLKNCISRSRTRRRRLKNLSQERRNLRRNASDFPNSMPSLIWIDERMRSLTAQRSRARMSATRTAEQGLIVPTDNGQIAL